MPVITLTISPLDVERKRVLAADLTRVAAAATGVPEDKFVVVIDEHTRDSIATGGKLLVDL